MASAPSVAEGAARGAAWNVATTLVTRGTGLVGTLLLTRFVSPRDMGEVSAASVCVLTVTIVTNMRLGQFLIAKKAGPDAAYNAMIAHLVTGVIGLALVIFASHQLGLVFDAPMMTKLVPGLALTALIERAAYVPERVLAREFKFRPLSIARSLGELAYTAVSLASAPFVGVMAVVFGNIVRATVVTGLTIRAASWSEYGRPAPLRWKTIKEMFVYSAPYMLGGIADFAAGRWDNLLIARYFGPRQLGWYNLAYNLAELPTGAVGDQVGDVLFPSFAKLEPERREPALSRAMKLMALLVFPLAVGLAAVSPTVVGVFFDARWQPVAPMLSILSVLSIARSVSWPLVSFMQAQHRQRQLMFLSFFKITVLIGGIMIFARFGPLVTCIGVGGTFVLDTLLVFGLVRVYDGVRILPLMAGLVPVILTCIAMAAGVQGIRTALHGAGLHTSWLTLGVEILVGGIVYVAVAFVVARSTAMDFLTQVKKVVQRRRGTA